MERCGGFGVHDLRPVWVSWLGMDICCGGLDEGPERDQEVIRYLQAATVF